MMRSELVVRGREGPRRIDRGPQRSTLRTWIVQREQISHHHASAVHSYAYVEAPG